MYPFHFAHIKKTKNKIENNVYEVGNYLRRLLYHYYLG